MAFGVSWCDEMREHNLKRIERELRIDLPAKYRDFMLAYPFSRYSWAGDLAMPNDADLLLDLNREARESHSGSSLGDVFVIGSDGGSTDYFIRLTDIFCGVQAYNEATHQVTTMASTFDDWLSQLAIQNQAHAQEKSYGKKWWEFWK